MVAVSVANAGELDESSNRNALSGKTKEKQT
jgi:hypothetical protein